VQAPGNSIGTQFVFGDYVLNPGAILEIELDPTPDNSDKVFVTGLVNLNGAVLRMAENGTYNPSTSYHIIDNDDVDPVTGTFAQVTANLAFLTPNVIYDGGDGNDVVLTLTRSAVASFCSVTRTRNQCNVADALDVFPEDNPLYLAVLSPRRKAREPLSTRSRARSMPRSAACLPTTAAICASPCLGG
jgi:hypothetical protein